MFLLVDVAMIAIHVVAGFSSSVGRAFAADVAP